MAPTSFSNATAIAGSRAKRKQGFVDVYNSTSTGHQVGSGVSKPAIYHKARVSKLQRQYRQNPPPLSLLASPTKGPGTRQRSASPSAQAHAGPEHPSTTLAIVPVEAEDPPTFAPASKTTSTKQPKRIFANCTVYINGTTAPAISDIMLKRHLSSHGACIATGLARKTVTHVIIGKPNGGQGDGAGGGLAAGKLHKELTKNGNLIKFVSVNWVLDSLKIGKMLSESKYIVLNMHGQKQKNILSFVKPTTAKTNIPNTISVKSTDAKSAAPKAEKS